MVVRSPGRGGGRTERGDRRTRARTVEGFDGGQDLAARAPVVFWEIDFNPWKPATLDRPQRSAPAERGEGRGQPFPDAAVGDQPIHLFDQHRGAGAAKFSDADVLAVGDCRLETLGDSRDAT